MDDPRGDGCEERKGLHVCDIDENGRAYQRTDCVNSSAFFAILKEDV